MELAIMAPAFAAFQKIPERFSRDRGNRSPQLEWRGRPQKLVASRSDPDAPKGTFRHWAAYNIPAEAETLPEGAGLALAWCGHADEDGEERLW